MTTLDELRERVSTRYDRLPLPSWPDPHPNMAAPREEEYSRLSQPERYQVVYARARVWAEVLGEMPEVTVDPLAPAPLDRDGHLGRFDRGVRLSCSRPDTLPLLLLERDVRPSEAESPLAVLHISVVEPEVAVSMQPSCGCDACDSGSDDLLDAIDDTVGNVIGGPFVVVRGPGWQAQWHQGGSSASGVGDNPGFTALQDLCRRLAAEQDAPLPEGAQAHVGRPWLG